MPNFGLMSGNPYYYGPSGLAAGVNAFAENLLNAYNTFSSVRQRDEEIAMQKKLMQIKLAEETNKEKMREAMANYESGLTKPVQGLMSQSQTFMPPSEIPSEWVQTPEARQVQPETVKTQVPTTFANQLDAWKAEGKNPEAEYLKGAYSVIAKFNPEKATELREKLYSATTNAELKDALLAFKTAEAESRLGLKRVENDLREKYMTWREKNAEENRLNALLLAALRKGDGGGESYKPKVERYINKSDGTIRLVDLNYPGTAEYLMQYGHLLIPEKEYYKQQGGGKRSVSGLRPGGGAGTKTIVKTGTDTITGRRVVQYSDGSVEYAN